MIAPPVIATLTAEGFSVRLDQERLIVSPADAITAPLRDLIRAAKPAILAYLAANDPDPVAMPRRLWLLRHADGRLISHSFTPPATEAEVRAWYPEATIEPEDEES